MVRCNNEINAMNAQCPGLLQSSSLCFAHALMQHLSFLFDSLFLNQGTYHHAWTLILFRRALSIKTGSNECINAIPRLCFGGTWQEGWSWDGRLAPKAYCMECIYLLYNYLNCCITAYILLHSLPNVKLILTSNPSCCVVT